MKKKYSIAIKLYRVERFLYIHNFKILAKSVYHFIQILLGCSIPPSVSLGEGVDIPHFHGIVLHQDTIVGEGTLIYQNVTVGGRNGKAGVIIGKNCVIASGACVLGNIKIGDNVNIGANAVVLGDVPDNSTAVGVPARIITRR